MSKRVDQILSGMDDSDFEDDALDVALKEDEQTCPYCYETIKIGSKKCKHCKTDLSDVGLDGKPRKKSRKQKKKAPVVPLYRKKRFLIPVLVLGILFLPLIFTPKGTVSKNTFPYSAADRAIKAKLKNPLTYKIISVDYSKTSSGGFDATIIFQAKNDFGVPKQRTAYVVANNRREITEVVIME